MQRRFLCVMSVLVVLLSFAALADAQRGGGGNRANAAPPPNMGFDPRDLSGVWGGTSGDRSLSATPPPFTPEGEAKFKTATPSRKRDARAAAEIDIQASNDPTFACNPRGFPRNMYDTNVRVWEFVHLRDRVMQIHQRERTLREIWMDGRKLPDREQVENLGPSWYGHSVGEWQGDTFVVNTVGLDDRAWIDFFGYPKSFEARVEESYKRVDPDTIELRITLFDPKYYTAPWVSDTKVFKRESRERLTFFGWYGMFSGVTELMCAPMNANPINKRGG